MSYKFISSYYKFIYYLHECVSDINRMHCFVICVYVCVYYNITLYNLIIRKFKEFVTCVMCAYCYHFVITFCYKVSDKKNSKVSDFSSI